MKKLLFLLGLSSTIPAQAFFLECNEVANSHIDDLKVDISINGEYSIYNRNKVKFEKVNFSYTIDTESEYPWSQGTQIFSELWNKQDYSPRVYTNHLKFSVYVGGAGSYGYGNLDLVLPRGPITSFFTKKPITGYLIMSHMDDHLGGTVELSCKTFK